MDELNSALLRLLQQDGRRTNRELAEELGIAPSTCLERVRALRERGVLLGFHAEVDLTALGRGLQAMIAVRVRPPTRAIIEQFQTFVARMPEVISVFVLTGTDDFLLHVAVRDADHLHSVVLDKLTERPELADVRTSMVYGHLRKTVIDPI
ncbi:MULTISPECIES: Lrp/AsnC family transcriptional regulator [unclassified Streptomyces]|uniref:Lrp/AsnC family transcriptional regulator n=1 Tax=unclassified Streptomyces TaxID=2593676 RepID=UPI00044B70B6|nr:MULTISPECIES: Lrp/AsnC family transcriptional regulator [unclassified Streptomyces]ANH92626.1 AsnC family transcriptional regulator [Streptomyces sp. SAT1]EYT80218.1 AsnC family transcriptional regulator [Streptomyces sp. Tu 6176]MYR62962.1 AsnC family transcriptional regulator [Streptomyces sp. SID625]